MIIIKSTSERYTFNLWLIAFCLSLWRVIPLCTHVSLLVCNLFFSSAEFVIKQGQGTSSEIDYKYSISYFTKWFKEFCFLLR